jgi:hypothetical protein
MDSFGSPSLWPHRTLPIFTATLANFATFAPDKNRPSQKLGVAFLFSPPSSFRFHPRTDSQNSRFAFPSPLGL